MDQPLDDLAFLANSQNRVAVLERLVDGPCHRDDLRRATGISRVTCSRILTDLEDRHWIDRTGQTCRITPLGAWVSDAFGELLETMAAQQRLRDVLPWFPVTDVEFDLRRLQDATVHAPPRGRVGALLQPVVACFDAASTARILTTRAAHPVLETVTSAVEAETLTIDGVLSRSLCESLAADPAMEPLFRRLLTAPGSDLVVTDEEPPVVLFVADETVGFSLTDPDGLVRALICTEDSVVRNWATETVDQYRTKAVPIGPAAAAR